MSLLDDIKEELQSKKQELEEKQDELTGLIDFMKELRHRLSDLEKELLASSIDSLVRNRKLREASNIQEEIDKNTLKSEEVKEQIEVLESSISLLEDKIS